MTKAALALVTCLLAVGLAASAWAQSRPASPTRPSGETRPSAGATTARTTDEAQRPAWSPDAGAAESSKLVGTKVETTDGKDVGSIDQLIVNQKDGKVTHVIIGKGGVLGLGTTKVALRWSDVKLHRDPDYEDRWLALVDPAKLESAPRYEARKAAETVPAASPSSTVTPDAGKTPPKAKRNAR
jgi:sporulation protein YlmC with PRC-barrel domain